jgi:glutamate--cysteine ligase
MARDIVDTSLIDGVDVLVDHHHRGCKPADAFLIGTEHEKIAFFAKGNRPVPYEGEASISAILLGMKDRLGWNPIMDEGKIIGLVCTQGGGAISLEPGGQFELSGAPLPDLHGTCDETALHFSLLQSVTEPLGIRFLGAGASPKWSLADTPLMPKSRYAIMRRYMPKVGARGLDMMYRTCTIQVNLDYASEADMRRKMQVSMKLQPLATALFASSPFTEGKPNGFLSWRSDVWRDTDSILPFVFKPDFGFGDYVNWALDVPMYFIVRDGIYRDCTHMTFRQFLAGGLKGEIKDWQANIGDWINHLSTLFPEVRLKHYLEMRGADGGPRTRICALAAFWVGLLYDEEALEAVCELTADWTLEDVISLREQVPALALNASLHGRPLLPVVRNVLDIARLGLRNRRRFNAFGGDESIFLAPLEEMVARGTTLAEDMLHRYHSQWSGSVDTFFEHYQC